MLIYAEALTLRPSSVGPGDIDVLREAGFSDAAIVDIASHVALFALMNRIVDGLGGRLSPGMESLAHRLGLPVHPETDAVSTSAD